METKSMTIMMMVADTARADLAFAPDRTYYRFATDSSIEDGSLAACADVGKLAADVLAAAAGDDGEAPLPSDVRVQIFVNNRLQSLRFSEASLRRLVGLLDPLAAEFTFLRGFLV